MSLSEIGAPLRVIELFAGVGGFRLGLEGLGTDEHPSSGRYQTVWSNQWEPSTRRQDASNVYVSRWGAEGHSNEDIFSVLADPARFDAIAQSRPDMLVGGFPCQDYSVAKPADKAAGLEGKKGVLWWAIHGILEKQAVAGHPVKYLLLENVDRLLKSPTACRGRDFAIILSSLAALGYAVEWRVVNAADYGFPQKRRRTFIVAYHRSTKLYERASSVLVASPEAWLTTSGVLPSGLPVNQVDSSAVSTFQIGSEPLETQARYDTAPGAASRFSNAGAMIDGNVWTTDVEVQDGLNCELFVNQDRPMTLGDVVAKTGAVSPDYLIDASSLQRWQFLKGSKRLEREAANGHKYEYSEGAMAFPDPLSRPARTVITSEGGSAPSRTKHVVLDPNGMLRRLTPDEVDELNGFPRGFTRAEGVSEAKRVFLMGNALVVGLVRRIGDALACEALKA